MTLEEWDRKVKEGEVKAQLARGEITSMQAYEIRKKVNEK